jgi:hypothetical protein
MVQFELNGFGQREIPSAQLTLADIPTAEARRTEILDFALTFDGYQTNIGDRSKGVLRSPMREHTTP